jgi:hypothetical protein
MGIEDDQPNYVESTHWAAILDNVSIFSSAGSPCAVKALFADCEKISLLKDRLGVTEKPLKKQHLAPSTQGPGLLVGSIRSATRVEILAALPSRPVVDALVAAFISTPDMGHGEFGFISKREPI